MKKILSFLGAVCFVLGFAMATGVDQNPVQALYCVVLIAGALVCFKSAKGFAARSEKKTPQTTQKVYDYKSGRVKEIAA